jgi:hypothetical protein
MPITPAFCFAHARRGFFELADIEKNADGGVTTLSIVEARDVSKDSTSGFLTCFIMLLMDEFCFERVEETLHRRVIITIGLAAHRGPKTGGLHHLAILRRSVLGGFKRSSHHPEIRGCDESCKSTFGASGRAPLPSPGRPSAAGRDEQNRFWKGIQAQVRSSCAELPLCPANRGRCNSIVKRVVRSTNVPIAELPRPRMRSASVRGSFRPDADIATLHACLRQRVRLVDRAASR